MSDKGPPANQPDLTPLFIILLIIIIAGLGSIRTCGPSEPNTGCAMPPPTQAPPPTPRPGPPVTTNLKQYTVQAGSFQTRDEANSLATSLRSKNINNFILQAEGQWLVCVGKYVSADRATRAANDLKARGVSNPVVLPPKKKK
jgi:cell division septation protein DedD